MTNSDVGNNLKKEISMYVCIQELHTFESENTSKYNFGLFLNYFVL